MKHEEIATITPVVMYREDLQALRALLGKLLPKDAGKVQLHGMYRVKKISSEESQSSDELFTNTKSISHVSELVLEVEEKDERGSLLRRIRVCVSERVSTMHLYSTEDDQWISETTSTLKDFFEQRRPWNWQFMQPNMPMLGLFVGLSVVLELIINVSKLPTALITPMSREGWSLLNSVSKRESSEVSAT